MNDYDVFVLNKDGEVFCLKDHIYVASAFEAKNRQQPIILLIWTIDVS